MALNVLSCCISFLSVHSETNKEDTKPKREKDDIPIDLKFQWNKNVTLEEISVDYYHIHLSVERTRYLTWQV